MAWLFLGAAGLLQVVWAYLLKVSEGFSRPVESAIAIVAMIARFWLLSLALKELPLGTAYTIWTGIGAVGAFILGIMVLGEAATQLRIASALLILAGIIGLRLAAKQGGGALGQVAQHILDFRALRIERCLHPEALCIVPEACVEFGVHVVAPGLDHAATCLDLLDAAIGNSHG
jgi:quaternary ammonium compound-resistance protein SugE